MNGFLENPSDGSTCPLTSAVCWPPETVDTVVVPVVMVVGCIFSEFADNAVWGTGYDIPRCRGTIALIAPVDPRAIAPPPPCPPFLGVEELAAADARWTFAAACCAI